MQPPSLSESQAEVVKTILTAFNAASAPQAEMATALLTALNAAPAPEEPPPVPPESPSLNLHEGEEKDTPVMTDTHKILTLEQAHRILSNPTVVTNSNLPMWLAKGGNVWHYCSPDVAQAEDWRSVGHLFR